MNVTYVAPFGLGQKTTVWARTLPMAEEIVRCGHHAAVVVPPWDTPEDSGAQSEQNGVRIIQVETSGGLPLIWRRLLREIDRLQPDIVHIVKPRAYAGLVQWWRWQRRRTASGRPPAILLDIDDWEQAWGPINDYSAPTERFLNWQEEWGIRHADGITAASRWLVQCAKAYSPETPVLYLPNGVTLPSESAERSNSKQRSIGDTNGHRILFFTRFVEIPPNWLARFWRSLLDQLPDCRMSVAGNALQPGREAAFQQALTALGTEAERRVAWLGHVDRSTISRLYDESDCAIFPAQAVPLQQAKCSVRLATTLLNGVPVVASAVGEQMAYGANGAADLVDADATPEAFAGSVHALLSDRPRQETMVRTAHQHLTQQYAWSRLGQDLLDFYEQFAS